MPRLGRKFTAGVGLVVALARTSAVSDASEDAGTRSIFAQGAGNRAIGMGGAFVAIADDASATMWNPAGLARAPRLELEAGQTSYFALGMSESYAAAVLPSWRWGAAAATFRHFGADGIERRDDRNQLVDGGLSDSESEFAVGYARQLSEAFGMGGTLKARRQSLAGFAASGFGVDFGLTVRPAIALGAPDSWARDITWGLALTNLIEPSLRLDRESVADPTTVQTGFAYRMPVFETRTLVAALDVEKSKDSGFRTHAGVECDVHPLLALRAGLNNGTLTAGTGLRWHDLSLDYVFEDNALGDVHRIGLSYTIGRTVSQQRDAALRAEENAIQSRLADAFQARQSEQIKMLLARVEERRASRRYDEALDLLATILTLDPSQTQASELEVSCWREKAKQLESTRDYAEAAIAFGRAVALAPSDTAAQAGLRRCQSEGDNRAARSAQLRQSYDRAMDAFASDDLAGARQGFRQILSEEPKDADAALMLRRTEEAIVRRTQSLIKQASRCIQGGLLSQASSLLDQASALDPRADGLAPLTAALARARQSASVESRTTKDTRTDDGQRATAPSRPRLSRRETELLYRKGVDALKEHRSDEALRYWELVWSADPSYQRVAEYLKREYLMRGMESFAAGRLDEAVGFWEHALQIDPTDERALGYLARAQKQLARTREILGNGR